MTLYRYLLLVPAFTSAILGLVYVFLGDARPAAKVGGALWFLAALYLQLASDYPLAGLLLQVVLALTLAMWKRANAS